MAAAGYGAGSGPGVASGKGAGCRLTTTSTKVATTSLVNRGEESGQYQFPFGRILIVARFTSSPALEHVGAPGHIHAAVSQSHAPRYVSPPKAFTAPRSRMIFAASAGEKELDANCALRSCKTRECTHVSRFESYEPVSPKYLGSSTSTDFSAFVAAVV